MTERTKPRTTSSLDALLSASRESFDRLFQHQMAGGRATPGAPQPQPSAQAAEPERLADGAGNVVAELNRRFATDWSAEVIRQEVRDGRAAVSCALTAAGQTRTETGTARIREDGDVDAAIRRAHDRALMKCVERLDVTEPTVRLGSEPASAEVDMITINRLDIALGAVRHEMEAVFARSALSPVPRGGPTGLAMITDGHGAMISGRAGSFLGHMMATQKLHFAPGDVLLLSDPFASAGASRSVDGWLVAVPVFNGTDLLGCAVMNGRMADVGGSEAGSRSARATSVFAEGLRIPPVKIYQAGNLNQTALDVILANSRSPDANRADLMALIDGCRAGAACVLRLAGRFGIDAYHHACRGLLERTREAVRRVIVQTLPEEPQSFEDQIDDDGCGNGPFTLRLTTWREDDHAYFDWTGTSAQAPGPVNFYLHVGLAKTFVGNYLMRRFASHIPANDGFYDLIHVTLPKGSLLNPDAPAAVGQGAHALVRQQEVLGGAVDRHVPERLGAAGCGAVAVFAFAGEGFRMTDRVFGGGPAQNGADGQDGASLWPGEEVTPAEDLERHYPVVIERVAAVAGSGGAGLCRGGNGVEKIYRVLAAGEVAIQDDRHASRPWGVNGGRPGGRSEKWIERADGGRETLPAKTDGLAVMANDRIVFRTAGGGGWGNPFERDAETVRRDVLAGLITAEAASTDYGVILQGDLLELDRVATEELRHGLIRERNRGKLFDRGGNA